MTHRASLFVSRPVPELNSPMTCVGCDLCGSSDAALLFVGQDPRGPDGFRTVTCRGCGLIYVSPRPEGPGLAAYYPSDYYEGLEGAGRRAERHASRWRVLRASLWRSLLEHFYEYPAMTGTPAADGLSQSIRTAVLHVARWRLLVSGREAAIIPFVGKGRLLDVGCGTGKDLEPIKEMGWTVTAIEMSPVAASIARDRLGCEVLVGDFEEAALGDESFDVIRFSHNLEHLASPRKALAKAWRILRPNGLLWIEVPNAASVDRWLFGRYWFGWDLPRHLYHFTPETLVRLLMSTGFRPVKLKCDGRVNFFTESVRNVLTHGLGVRPRRMKIVSTLVRPLVYALGAVNRGAILTVHAKKDAPRGTAPLGKVERARLSGVGPMSDVESAGSWRFSGNARCG